MFKHVPNILTIIRFLLIPFIIYFLAINQYIIGVILFIISGITDVVDGAIARKFNFITDFGKLMDPLADKLTQISVLATLMFKNLIKSRGRKSTPLFYPFSTHFLDRFTRCDRIF